MSEAQIQKSCVMWFWNNFPEQRGLLYMNYNNPKNKTHGAILLGLGLVAGVADLSYLKNGKMHYIEMKTEEGSQQKNQKKFEDLVKSEGAEYHIIRNLESFKELIFSINEI